MRSILPFGVPLPPAPPSALPCGRAHDHHGGPDYPPRHEHPQRDDEQHHRIHQGGKHPLSPHLHLTRGDLELASRTLEEGIDLSGRTKDRANLAHFLDALAAVDAFRDEAERSATLLGTAEALLEEVGARVHNYYAPDPSLRERAIAEARASLGATAFEEAWGRGRGMSFDRAVEYALGVDTERPL